MKLKALPIFLALLTLLAGCSSKRQAKEAFIEENIEFAAAQTQKMLEVVGEPTGNNYPRTIDDKGGLRTTGMYDWTPGFFPGSLWYLYELTGEEQWKDAAESWTNTLEPLKSFTDHHDLGFMVFCSFGNAERLAPKSNYNDIIVESANSLCTRYSEATKSIKSWNYGRAWNGETEWFYPVIIDNMMNLELLFYASKITGDDRYYNIAVEHANSTLKNHFREDYSTYHVVDYETKTGQVLDQSTCQGYSDNSMWARGQAWAIYGYTMTYRETKDERYLETAVRAADIYLKNLPEDLIPLWDFNVGEEGYEPEKNSRAVNFRERLKDTSAAAIVCSALFELAEHAENPAYTDYAIRMLQSLSSPDYRAALGENGNFLIMHGVGSIPHGFEVDTPITYIDYYFLESLVRYKNLKEI